MLSLEQETSEKLISRNSTGMSNMAAAGEIEDESEEDLIRYYFLRGFQYGEIKNFLSEYHEKEMSISTLKRRIKSYGLSRRNPDYDEQTVRDAIRDMIDGPACLRGYRSVWHGLQLQGLLQKELNEIKEHWNTHFIRKSRHDTISGRPDSLYYLPQLHGGSCNLSLPVPLCELDYVRSHVVETEEENEYQEYFQYLAQTCNLSKPEHWRDALRQYYTIHSYA